MLGNDSLRLSEFELFAVIHEQTRHLSSRFETSAAYLMHILKSRPVEKLNID